MKIETEYKFIIEKPDIETVKSMTDYTESKITQIYLGSEGTTHRVRRREYSNGEISYTENKKVRISKMSSTEFEREISAAEFESLSGNIEKGSAALKKTRRTFDYRGKTFELDYYDGWKNTCIMEVELESEDEKFEIPQFIKILLDVTGNKLYSNHSMAHSFPSEIL